VDTNTPKSTVDSNTRPPPKAPIFVSFCQEPIPLHEQFKEQLNERQKKPQEQDLQKKKKKPQSRHPPRPSKPQYPPQPSKYRHCKEEFDTKNALFRHLKHYKTSRSTSRSSSRSRASSVSSSTRLTASSTSSIASIEKVQLQILGQLHAIQAPKKSIPYIVPQRQPQMPAQTPPHTIYTPN